MTMSIEMIINFVCWRSSINESVFYYPLPIAYYNKFYPIPSILFTCAWAKGLRSIFWKHSIFLSWI